jgi:hypothetical protein
LPAAGLLAAVEAADALAARLGEALALVSSAAYDLRAVAVRFGAAALLSLAPAVLRAPAARFGAAALLSVGFAAAPDFAPRREVFVSPPAEDAAAVFAAARLPVLGSIAPLPADFVDARTAIACARCLTGNSSAID